MKAAFAALLVFVTPVVAAAECPLSAAIYDQAETGFTLEFRAVTPEDGLSTSNAFAMTVPGSDKRVDGTVIWGNGFSRPIGYLHYGCPPDATLDDEELCRRWQGIVYAVNGSTVALLAEEDGPAPEQLILSNLGQSIRYSGLIEALQTEIADPPWDVFSFKGCTN